MAKAKTQAQQSAESEKRWRAEQDLRTLQEAEVVKTDPGRVRAAKAMARDQQKALQKVVNNGSRTTKRPPSKRGKK